MAQGGEGMLSTHVLARPVGGEEPGEETGVGCGFTRVVEVALDNAVVPGIEVELEHIAFGGVERVG